MKILKSTQLTIICKPIHKVKWPVPKVLAFTTTRQTPYKKTLFFSLPPFNYFNLGLHVGDEAKAVLHNRQSLLELLPDQTKIQWLEQVHAAEVLVIDKHHAKALIADAVITRQKKIALAIMTADCLPILLTAKDGSEIAAIHGGWKPLAKNIIVNTLDKMLTPNEDIVAWLGPCIGKNAFEVGEDVKLAFENNRVDVASAFSIVSAPIFKSDSHSSNKYLADLAMIAEIQLNAFNVKVVNHLSDCTFTNAQQYFSFRRDTITGRMASVICRV